MGIIRYTLKYQAGAWQRHSRGQGGRQTGWGDLRGMPAYKAVIVVAINPAYTSQTCHACGHVSAVSRPCQARFECVSSGHTAQADVNAARNILPLGTGATGRQGALALATPLTRQPVLEAA